jgi:glycosyltransferase involved in cell wall biosynthesis
MPNVSVCIPTYNREKLLKQTLDSVFAQTYKDFEVVIVDDGSTDGTKQMLERNGYKVRYHRQENSGDAAARNKLIELAQGRYITFLDSDDLLFGDSLEQMVAAMPANSDETIVYGAYTAIDEFGNNLYRREKKLYGGRITQYLFENILIHSCGSLFPKKVLIEAGGFNTSFPVCSDYDLWLRLSLKYDFVALQEPVFKRRRHGGNLSQPSFRNRYTEYEVLRRFYLDGGGKEKIPFKAAMKRLAKEQYRAARSAIRESKIEEGYDLLTSSLKRHFNLKTLFWLLATKVKCFNRPQPGILVISNNPSRASYRQRINEYLPYLHKAGIKTKVEKLPDNILTRWLLFISSRNFDGVFLHKKSLNILDAEILRFFSKVIIYDFDDAIMYSPTKPESDRTRHFRAFRQTAEIVDVIIAGNEYLAEHARRFCPKVYLLETGLDTSAYKIAENRKRDDKIRLVWIGSKATLKYLVELKDALEDLGKSNSKIVLRIIADDFFDLENMPVEKCKWSIDSQYSDIMECDIGLAPLPDDRFTRGKCGFKTLQYFSAGLPVVASPVCVNGELILKSGAGFVAQTNEQWKEQIIKLVQNETLRKEMGRKGKEYVKQYDLAVLGERFCGIIKENCPITDFVASRKMGTGTARR